ncbi:MAG TPA: UDP-N-acetylglucosamine 4,6-dehydratase (inverting) [Vicinamibacterales bacterium]|nr:UDP-N-acetylglucosamine 4,6-dehydratase (inverting) [Vicinamibacterales bacterium]
MDWSRQTVLVTGGTGSFGKKFVEIMMREYRPQKLIVFSRDELKQYEMRQTWAESSDSPIRYFIGDIRDRDRLNRALHGVDIVVHAAAMKQVPACEYNPFEAIQTNVHGAKNIIDAAIDARVKKVMALSTDKAVNPVNLYGATKLVAEKLFVQGNSYVGDAGTRLACVRYGNVVGSRGSVIPLFLSQRKTGRVTVTDDRMTRFWITLEEAVRFVVSTIEQMSGGEIFVPKIPSMRIMDLVNAIAPGCRVDMTGIRPGEKLHEALLSDHEAAHTLEFDNMFVVQPEFTWWSRSQWEHGRSVTDGFRYTSETNTKWLSRDDLMLMAEDVVPA